MIDNEFEKQINEYIKLGKSKKEVFEKLSDGSFRDVFLSKELSQVAANSERYRFRILHNTYGILVCYTLLHGQICTLPAYLF